MHPDCKKIRQNILEVAYESGHGHIPTSFSVVEILCAIYESMQHDPSNPTAENRDIFILSKGHASLAHYCTLAKFGYFDVKEVFSYCAYGSKFGGHQDRLKVPGSEVSCGSLGHGIGVAVGIALAFKIKKSPRRVFTIIGDGESNEGSVWEALLVAANLKLNNLTVIYDNNMSHSRGLQIQNPVEKLTAFDCETLEIDGHDVEALKTAFDQKTDQVKAVVANTTKGYGCRTFLADQYAWHRRSPNDEEFKTLMQELNEETV